MWLVGRNHMAIDPRSAITAMGQTEKNSVRAHVFRFALELGHCLTQSACLKGANFGSERTHSIASSARAGSEGGMVSSISGHARHLARCDRASRDRARAQDHV